MSRDAKKLLFACKNGNLGWAKAALEAGVDPNELDTNGTPALVIAARNGHSEIALMLLDRGAQQRHEALAEAPPQTAEALRAWKPIAERGHSVVEQQQLLCKAAEAGDLRGASELLEAGVDPSTPFQSRAPMLMAAMMGHLDMMRLLYSFSAPVDGVKGKDTALHWAVFGARAEALKLLLEWGAEVDARTRGETPLHQAAEMGNVELMQILLEAGADPDVRDAYNMTPLERAQRRHRYQPLSPEVFRLLGAPAPSTRRSKKKPAKKKSQPRRAPSTEDWEDFD